MIYRETLVMFKALFFYVCITLCITAYMLFSLAMHETQFCGTSTLLSGWVIGASYAPMLFAAIYGVGLGNASREGARVFWVLPQGRWQSAVGLVGVDVAGIMIAFAVALIASAVVFVAGSAVGRGHCAVINDLGARNVLSAIAFPLAVYGWSTLVGMLLRRAAYMGIVFLPIGMLAFGFSHVPNALGAALRSVAFANPFNMIAQLMAPQLFAIAVATLLVSIVLWQRAEVVA